LQDDGQVLVGLLGPGIELEGFLKVLTGFLFPAEIEQRGAESVMGCAGLRTHCQGHTEITDGLLRPPALIQRQAELEVEPEVLARPFLRGG